MTTGGFVGQLDADHIGTTITVHLDGLTVTGRLVQVHHQTPITRPERAAGARVWVYLDADAGYSWSQSMPSDVPWTAGKPAHVEER